MKSRRRCLGIMLFLLGIVDLYGQQFQSLTVLDPQTGWPSYSGTFEEISITLRPVGLYTEVGLYLTISAKGTNFPAGRPLEAVMGLNLPDQSIVNDSWLWVDSTIIRAKILDRWTASTIYENIVRRRQDPSILTKVSRNQYALRVYPLTMGQTRRLKINYLVPGIWSSEEVQSIVPTALFRNSPELPPIDLRLFLEEPWQNPRLSSHPALKFAVVQDASLGTYHHAKLSADTYSDRDIILSLKAPLKNGLYLTRYGDEQEGYYQMALLPDQFIPSMVQLKPRRVLLLLHYNASTAAGLTVPQLLNTIAQQLKRVLQPRDSFNVMLAGLNPQALSPSWISASASEIDRIFNGLSGSSISSLNFSGLLGRAIEWVKANGQDTKVLLFSSSVSEGEVNTSNELIKALSALKGDTPIPFFIADYARQALPFYYVGNQRFWGNEYFYLNWAKQTQGDYYQQFYCCSDLDILATRISDLLVREKAELDVHTSLQNGFCFNRYNLKVNSETSSLRLPILQVGRYRGKWPFVVELSGQQANDLFFSAAAVPLAEATATDSTGADTWGGQYIQALEYGGTFSNATAAEIISTSIQRRILSAYTAFLCLEPSQGGEPCLECLDRSQGQPTVGTQDLQDSLIFSKISPNPFFDKVMIQLKFKDLIDLSKARLVIYNQLGQLVRSFTELPTGKIQDLELQWNGQNDFGNPVPPGLYLFHLQTPNGQYIRKLVKVAAP